MGVYFVHSSAHRLRQPRVMQSIDPFSRAQRAPSFPPLCFLPGELSSHTRLLKNPKPETLPQVLQFASQFAGKLSQDRNSAQTAAAGGAQCNLSVLCSQYYHYGTRSPQNHMTYCMKPSQKALHQTSTFAALKFPIHSISFCATT